MGWLATAKRIWEVFNGPNNDPVIVGFLIAFLFFLISHITQFVSYRSRLKDKDKEIERLVAERDKLQDFVLNEIGSKRLTTRLETNRKEGE